MSQPNLSFSPERWKAIEPFVDHALDLPEDQRAGYLAQLKQDDAAFGAIIEWLVGECERPDPRLDNSAPERFGYLLDESMPPPLSPETVLAQRYRIEREIGRGGMAIVYLANDVKLDRQVAVKVMRRTSLTTTAARRFSEEIRLTGKLRHPNIVPLYDAGESEEHAFFVMPFIEGESLRARIERGGPRCLTIREALRIGIEVARALEYAHDHGVIHRDVKPSNLLLTSGVAMLADFGIARAEEAEEHITEVGMRLGTPAYMSPEQVSGEVVDRQTDIYSLGCVLYEMIGGVAPVAAAPRLAALMRGADPVSPLRGLNADVSPKLEACVGDAIATEKNKRIATAGELVRRLEACARDYGVAVAGWKRLYWRAPRRVAAAAVVGAAAIAAGAYILVRRVVPPVAPPATPGSVTLAGSPVDTSRIVVLPFEHRGGAPALADEDDRVREALRRWDPVVPVDRLETRNALARRDTAGEHLSATAASEIGRAVRASRYVSGEVTRDGDSTVLRAGLYDTRTGIALANAVVRIPSVRARSDAPFVEIADRLLFPDLPQSTVVTMRAATHSRPALQAYAEGEAAIAAWDLERADAALERATNYDQQFARAYLWLAQVRSWRELSPARWQFAAHRAIAARSSLGARDRRVAEALTALAALDSAKACDIWRSLTRNPGEESDFAAWFGVAQCEYYDRTVVRDPRSPSGWSFRSSHHHATSAFHRAFQILPAIHREFRASWYFRLKGILRTQRTQLRFGTALRPDTGQFAAYPSWSASGDSLEFVPYPVHAFELGRTDIVPPTLREAVAHQRAVFLDIATTWRAAFRPSADALLAVAVALDEAGDSAAVDSVHAARRLADEAADPAARLRTGAAEVWILVKRSLPNDVRRLEAARALADTVLRSAAERVTDSTEAIALASLAALTGHPHKAARFARRSADLVLVPGEVAGTVRGLQAYAALGGPVDSIRALATSLWRSSASGKPGDRARWMRRAATLAFPVYQDSAVRYLARTGDFLAVAENAWLDRDTATIRKRLLPLREGRKLAAPEDLKPEALYPEAWLLASVGDTATALDWISPMLDAQERSSIENLRTVVTAGALVRAMVLRAELANRLGRKAEATQWARAAATLWSGADDDLQPVVREMKRLAK